MIRKLPYFVSRIVLVGCASNGGNFAVLFSAPESLQGQNVSECGFLHYAFENVNFYPNRRQATNDEFGIGVSPGRISDSQLRDHHNQKVCLTGQVDYAGCAVTAICTGSKFLYEIVVDDLELR